MTDQKLVWYPQDGYGVLLPTEEYVYGDSYYNKYFTMESSPVGHALIKQRFNFVDRHVPVTGFMSNMIDVGVGAGGFVFAAHCMGYDVCKKAVNMLKRNDRFHDLPSKPIETACFWDSLEHIVSPEAILANVNKHVFVSMPIYESGEHVLTSRHYRPNEHIWYFTEKGFIKWMKNQGWTLVEKNRDEERHGREDIGSFYFNR
jgi:hypothetical protein